MVKRFHETEFDDATQVKLAIFRGCIREWIPVFLTAWKEGSNRETINLWDFFAGPGTDATGNPGSPRIIQDELKAYCDARGEVKAAGLQVRLYFNDKLKKHVRQLQQCLAENGCSKGCCEAVLSSKPFQEAFAEGLPIMQKPRSANLVIMDQFGVKEVTPAVVKTLAGCQATDILFFVSSSYVRRFADEPAIQSHFQMTAEDLAASGYKSIHRHICDYFRSTLPRGSQYHLAPFSIQKSTRPHHANSPARGGRTRGACVFRPCRGLPASATPVPRARALGYSLAPLARLKDERPTVGFRGRLARTLSCD